MKTMIGKSKKIYLKEQEEKIEELEEFNRKVIFNEEKIKFPIIDREEEDKNVLLFQKTKDDDILISLYRDRIPISIVCGRTDAQSGRHNVFIER